MKNNGEEHNNAKHQLDLLIDFGKKLSAETGLEKLLVLIAKQISRIIGARNCFIFIIDEKHHALWSKIARGKGLKYTEVHLPLNGDSVAAAVAKTGKAINIADAYSDIRFSKGLDLLSGTKTTSLLAVPLINKEGKVIGVFQINNKENGQAFDKNDEGILNLLATLAAGNIEIAALYEDLKISNMETLYRLAFTAEYRDQGDTKTHLRNISEICYLLAKAMRYDEAGAEIIKNASILHDIGKVAIPDEILLKPGKLTAEEYEIMKTHTFYGGKILQGAKSKVLQTAHKMSLYHHERYDGTGYPAGLKGNAIPIEARILAVADVFDALSMCRVYKDAWETNDVYNYILENTGTLFDPEVIQAFKAIFPALKQFYKGKQKTYRVKEGVKNDKE